MLGPSDTQIVGKWWNKMTPETKALNLWNELSFLLVAYRQMVKDTNSEPLFENEITDRVESALFANRPSADWEAPLNRARTEQAGKP